MKKWISVIEILPEKEGRYLTYWTDGEIETFNFDTFSRRYFEGATIHQQMITHWMNLPEPPEETK